MPSKVTKTEDEWKKQLSPTQYKVLRGKNTELPFSGKYVKFDKKGEYVCAGCGNNMFASETKFDSQCGWPSFSDAEKDSVEFKQDNSYGMDWIEVICKKCGGHLGHIFDDGPKPSGKRFCINSLALDFKEKK